MVAAVVGQPVELVRPLMQSLETDLLPRDDRAQEIFGLRRHSFDRAVDHALREWESDEDWGPVSHGKLERTIEIDAPPERVYDVLTDPRCLGQWVTIQEELDLRPRSRRSRRATASCSG